MPPLSGPAVVAGRHPVANRDRAWAAGTAPPDRPALDDEPSAEGVPDDRWVYLFGLTAAEDGGYDAESVGVWRAGSDGAYTFAVPGEASEPGPESEEAGEVLTDVGDPSPYVLVDAGLVEPDDPTESLYAHVSYVPLPPEQVAATGQRQTTPDGPVLTPLHFGEDRRGASGTVVYEREAEHTAHEDRVWKWYLPDPVAVSARLAEIVRDETEAYETWEESAALAGAYAGFVAAAAYSTAHRRRCGAGTTT